VGKTWILLVSLVFGAQLALAQTTTTTTSTDNTAIDSVGAKVEATADVTAPAAPSKPAYNAGSVSFFYGPTVQHPTDKKTSDSAKDAEMGLATRHQLFFTYALSKRFTLMPTADFDYQITDPVSADHTGIHQFRWRDAFVRLNMASPAEYALPGGSYVVVPSDLRVYLPTGKTSRDNDTIAGVRFSLNPGMQFARSPISISTVNYVRYWIQPGNVVATAPMFEIYTGPQVNYAVNDSINAFLLFEAVTNWNHAGMPNMTDTSLSLADLEPGVDFRVGSHATVTPYLNWYTNQPIRTTSMNLSLALTLY